MATNSVQKSNMHLRLAYATQLNMHLRAIGTTKHVYRIAELKICV